MAATMTVDIVSAEEEIWSGTAKMVFAPAVMGEVGVMPKHTPLLTKIKPGEVRVINEEDEEEFFFVSGGMLEILPTGVTVLADTAQRAKDLDEAAALQAKDAAERALAEKKGEVDYAAAEAELANAIAQIEAIRKLKKKLGK
jgi:F-type H+-transporting ATPase subunit epsilon